MRLPPGLVHLRSWLAQAFAAPLRWCAPLSLRLGRFKNEVRARSLLVGPVAPGVQFIGSVQVEGEGRVVIGAGTRIGRNAFFETYGPATIHIGQSVTINDGVVMVAYSGIVIGDHAMIGEYTSIRDANHGTSQGQPVRLQPHVSSPIYVGEDAWLGRGVFVGKGVCIGAGAVIGANSVVTKNIEPQTIAAGVPARQIGMREP